MYKYKIRYHLANGEHKNHWQVKDKNNSVDYIDPICNTLVLEDCKLVNQKCTANRIFRGSAKSVCAWIECRSYLVVPKTYTNKLLFRYNPKVCPYWTDENNNNLDNTTYPVIYL